jgi:predicted RNA-binding Zn ribbon-like protein
VAEAIDYSPSPPTAGQLLRRANVWFKVKCISMVTLAEPAPPLPAGIRELPIVAGHLALDFANTVDDPLGPDRFDHLADYPRLLFWSQRVGLLTDRTAAELRRAADVQPRAAAAAVRRAHSLRAALNDTFGPLADGDMAAAGWDQLRSFVTAAVQNARVTTTATSQASLRWDFTAPDSPLWPVAEASFSLLTGPELTRLKRCVGCPWLFLDRSKNRSRRWCSMEFCGTDEKMRRYVSKRAERRTAGQVLRARSAPAPH